MSIAVWGALLLLLLDASSALTAASWDVGRDFSGVNNPNGAWSYGRKWSATDGSLDRFTIGDDWGTGTPYYWWFGNWGHGAPALAGTPGGTGTSVSMWAKDDSNGLPVARWTCAKSGKYHLKAQFSAGDSRGMDSSVYVVINSSIQFSNRIQGYPQTVSFTNDNLLLRQGDLIDFVVMWGGGSDSEASWTSLGATVTDVVPDAPRLDIRVSQVEMCWQTTTNTWYQLQYRSALTTNLWIPLTGQWVAGDGMRYCTTDGLLAGTPQRFYQLLVTNSPPQ